MDGAQLLREYAQRIALRCGNRYRFKAYSGRPIVSQRLRFLSMC